MSSDILILTLPLLMTFSILFSQLQHPLAMGLLLLVQTLLISVTAGLSMYSFWVSYILFLIFLGGMLILFMYVASLASNEMFYFKFYLSIFFSIMFLFSILMIFLDPMISFSPNAFSNSNFNFSMTTPMTINWIYNSTSMMFTIFIVSYLFLMLFVIMKIMNLSKGPLRLNS
uniref:NADH-ubiquinone oxidoreductase chain 6 n=1 Tax=Xenograpsus testudinatus TaxID=533011 RepID=D0PS56_9EUCA|nr:NADH dehydrogenase subunit 6 [Xenograpsus testudinatus]ACF08707.1 NADH dehydrogenase subunit 6 [Xenograpsus testudinatus]